MFKPSGEDYFISEAAWDQLCQGKMMYGLTVQLDLLVYCFNLGSWNINNSLNKCIPASEQWGVGRRKGREGKRVADAFQSQYGTNTYPSVSF